MALRDTSAAPHNLAARSPVPLAAVTIAIPSRLWAMFSLLPNSRRSTSPSSSNAVARSWAPRPNTASAKRVKRLALACLTLTRRDRTIASSRSSSALP